MTYGNSEQSAAGIFNSEVCAQFEQGQSNTFMETEAQKARAPQE